MIYIVEEIHHVGVGIVHHTLITIGQGYYLPLWDQDAYYEAVNGGGGILGEAGSRADDVEQGDFWTGYYQNRYYR